MAKSVGKCTICGGDLTFRYKPMENWNISGYICSKCYGQKLLEHYIEPDRRSITKK